MSGLSDQALSDCYAQATALVLPSRYEGFGLPVIEALAAGTSVTCSDLPVFREVSGGRARTFAPGDREALSFLLDEAAREGHSVAVGPSWAAGFTWELAAARLHELYLRLSDES